MPKRVEIGVVTSDKTAKTRRVEIPRLVQASASTASILRRKTVCHVHDENNESHVGDTVEIVESRPLSQDQALGAGAGGRRRAGWSTWRRCGPPAEDDMRTRQRRTARREVDPAKRMSGQV